MTVCALIDLRQRLNACSVVDSQELYTQHLLAIAALGGTLQHSLNLGKFVGILTSLIVLSRAASVGAYATTVDVHELNRGIPARASDALTGSQFAQYVSKMNIEQREDAIRREALKGNVPEFLRKLAPVELHYTAQGGKTLDATIFVTPDYLAIGSDADFLRIPMNLHTALAIADQFGFTLPTRKIVDAVYVQSSHRLVPQPLPAGPEMRSSSYYWMHNQMVERQAHALGIHPGELVAGHKKDVVLTNLLSQRVGRIAIYGWHRGPGAPIQLLSTVHGADYADYSHGIRLVSTTVLIDRTPRSIYDVFKDPSIAKILSDEGSIQNIGEFFPLHRDTIGTSIKRGN